MSTSIGPKGLTLNLGKRGARATVALPGTGLSYTTQLQAPDARSSSIAGPRRSFGGLTFLVLFGVIVLVALRVGIAGAPSLPRSGRTSSPVVKHTVSMVALACRIAPDVRARKLRTLHKSDVVSVLEVQGDWSRVDTGGFNCWSASRFLQQTS